MRGHIVKRYKNSYTIVLNMGYDPVTGKRLQQWVSVKGNRKEAEKRLSELLHQLDTGGFIKPSKVNFGEFIQQWLKDYASANVKPKTFEGYKWVMERHIIPTLGNIPLINLQPQHLQEYYAKELSTGLSNRSVLSFHRLIFEALSHAVKWGLISRNVAQAVDPPRPKNLEMQTLDAYGVQKLLETAKTALGGLYYPVLHLAVYTGMRRSELLGLRWKDVDLLASELSVVQVMHQLSGSRIVFQDPKTAKSKRLIALPPSATLILRAHREKQEAERTLLGKPLTRDDLVFSHLDGSPLRPDTITHAFIKIAEKACLNIRFHDLRHTHASLMLKQGIHPKIVQERLGHASIQITLDTYSHVTPGLQEAAAKRFDEFLSTAPSIAEKEPVLKNG